MAQEMNPKSPKSPALILGIVAGAVAVIALVALAYIKMQNLPFNKGRDIGLLAVAIVGALTWAICNKDELLRVGGSRGMAMNVNAFGTLLAVFGILLMVNYWIVPRQFGDKKLDLTAGKYYSLSTQTKNIVKTIKSDNPVELFALVPMDRYSQISPDTARSLELNKKRLEEYKRLNPNLTVTTLDPYVSKRATEVAKESGLTALPSAGCLLRFKKDPKAVESVPSLDESQITRSLSKLLDDKGKKRKVYFLTGHGEVAMAGPAGQQQQQDPLASDSQNLAQLKQALTDDRFEVVELPMAKEIPADCTVLATVGAKAPFAKAELDTMRKYLQNNGRLFAVLDPSSKSNLADLLKEYGIEWQTGMVEDQALSVQEPSFFYATNLGSHPIVNDLKKSRLVAVFNRTGSFKQGTVPTEMEYSSLVTSSPTSAVTGGPKGPFDLVAAVGKRAPVVDPKDDKAAPDTKTELGTRIVAVGTPWFLTLPIAGGQVANSLIATDAVNWLSDNTKDMGIRPKNPWDDEKDRKIEMTKAKLNKVMLFTFLLPLLLCIGAGIAMSVARSRR